LEKGTTFKKKGGRIKSPGKRGGGNSAREVKKLFRRSEPWGLPSTAKRSEKKEQTWGKRHSRQPGRFVV